LDGIKSHPAGNRWKRRGKFAENGHPQAGFSARDALTGD